MEFKNFVSDFDSEFFCVAEADGKIQLQMTIFGKKMKIEFDDATDAAVAASQLAGDYFRFFNDLSVYDQKARQWTDIGHPVVLLSLFFAHPSVKHGRRKIFKKAVDTIASRTIFLEKDENQNIILRRNGKITKILSALHERRNAILK